MPLRREGENGSFGSLRSLRMTWGYWRDGVVIVPYRGWYGVGGRQVAAPTGRNMGDRRDDVVIVPYRMTKLLAGFAELCKPVIKRKPNVFTKQLV